MPLIALFLMKNLYRDYISLASIIVAISQTVNHNRVIINTMNIGKGHFGISSMIKAVTDHF